MVFNLLAESVGARNAGGPDVRSEAEEVREGVRMMRTVRRHGAGCRRAAALAGAVADEWKIFDTCWKRMCHHQAGHPYQCKDACGTREGPSCQMSSHLGVFTSQSPYAALEQISTLESDNPV